MISGLNTLWLVVHRANSGQFVQGCIYVYILKIRVFVQILFDVNLNFIEQFNFLEIFCDVDGINQGWAQGKKKKK